MGNNRLLISKEDFYEYKSIVQSSDPSRIMNYVLEAQKFDLVSVINKELIEDIQENLSATRNQALIPFIKPVLCYYSYARYINFGNVSDSATGLVQKTNEFSTPASEKMIARLSLGARSLALGYAEDLVKYLNDNKTTYPLWKSGCGPDNRAKGSFSITEISIK